MSHLGHELAELGGDIKVALEEIGVPASLVDSSGKIRWQNEAARREVGDHAGEHVTSLFSPAARERVEAALAKLLSRGEPIELRLPVRGIDGSFVVREISAVPLRGGGTIVGIFGLRQPGGETANVAERRPFATLTPRQREVLNMLAAGKSTQQISADLRISPTTVRNHVANLMAALGVHTRLQAVIAAGRAGLLDSAAPK